MPNDLSRRRALAALGAAAAAGVLGAGTALVRRLGHDGATVDAGATSTSRTTSTTTAESASGPTSTSTSRPPDGSAPSSSTPGSPKPTDPTASSETLEVICRASWGAAAPTGSTPKHTIDELTVHHTAAVLSDNRKAPTRVRSFQKGHQDDGFVDLAYHYVIDAHGNVYEGRSTNIPGETYTSYDPTGHFLAVCDGNFEEQAIPAAQLDALALLLAWASARFGVASSHLTGHRDEAPTACPGEHLYAHLRDGSLRAKIDAHLAKGAPKMLLLCGADGAARVQQIKAGTR